MSKATEVIVILDRSGSMQTIRQATVDGLNKFIADVQRVPGEGYWTLVMFDDWPSATGAGESFPKVVFEKRADREMKLLELADFVPRGGTALVDAAYITLQRAKDRWMSLHEIQRPKVMVVIVTDGAENASKNYTRDQLRELTAEVQSKYKWEFIYLGANQDSFAESSKIGITPTSWMNELTGGCLVSNRINYEATDSGVLSAMNQASAGTRAWKADGNPTAEQLMGAPVPDLGANPAGGNP